MLWEKRTLLKKKKEKKMKMIHNGQERLDNGGRIGMFERVKEEIGLMVRVTIREAPAPRLAKGVYALGACSSRT